MAAWRRIALELFPEWEREILSPPGSPYSLFGMLLPVMRQALRDGDEAVLRKVFALAEWALRQPDSHLRNAAGVSFFEHVFDGPAPEWPAVAEWLSPYVVDQVSVLWETMLPPARLAEVRELLRRRTRHRHARVSEVWAGIEP